MNGVTDDNLDFHPMMGGLRAVLEAAASNSVPATSAQGVADIAAAVLQASQGSSSSAELGRRLTPDVHRDLKRDAIAANPTEFWSPADLPCKALIQSILTMVYFSVFEMDSVVQMPL